MTTDDLRGAIDAAPPDLKSWLQTQSSFDVAWAACDRADWLFWLAQPRVVDDQQRRRLVAAVASALRTSDHPGVSRRRIIMASAWTANNFRDQDPTGFAATIIAVAVAAAVGIAIDLWLYLRHDNPIRGMQREVYSMPVFLVLAFVGRIVARPLLKRRWESALRGYSFERAESDLFPRLPDAVERSSKPIRRLMADVFRKRMAGH
jgi:hypothetical protein